MKPDSSESSAKLDPLYEIFERHLNDVGDQSDPLSPSQAESSEFIDTIVNEYVQYLSKKQVVIPIKWKAQIIDELRDQVRHMLVKKTYGCLSIEEYRRKEKAQRKRRRRFRLEE